MANAKISELPAAGALSGAELVEIVQGGINKQSTAQDIADLGGGGGTWGSITGTLSSQTDLQDALDLKLDSLVSMLTFTASHTLDSTDLASVEAGDQLVIRQNSGSANNLEIPLNATVAFPIGTIIGIRNINTGVVTITAAVGVTLQGPLSAFKLNNQYDMAYIEKVGTNTWVANGQLSI